MTLFKCKMCGGSIDVVNNESVAECEYCGTKQTLPKMDDEKRINLYNRANHFRQQCAFDKAEQIYEKIVAEMPDDAEAHWSLVLCRYGIEYVEDPSTLERVPTCHRASYDSIFDDIDYIEAVNKADTVAMSLYQKEAAKIDRIQKGILEISQKEKPFDIFICYKETDSIGERTLDSVKAQEIYDTLTDKGYKVFFSRITLEDKLGQSYEPYIFAALNSAKVMLVVGANPDYINSVWVKNEWSRYLKIMSKKKDRTLIPCYLNMSPYELPDEFSYLQGQDMSKIGFMQDLVKGIGKLIPKNNHTVQKTTAVPDVDNKIKGLINLIGFAIEEKNWDKADDLCEQIMMAQPDSAFYYVFKMIIGYEQGRNISNVLQKLNKLYTDISDEEKSLLSKSISSNVSTLSRAIVSKSIIAVRILLEIGIDPNKSYRIEDNERYSPLSDAITKSENAEIVKLLLEHGADPNLIEDMTYNDGAKGQKSMLTYAVLDIQNADIVKLLLEHGANPNESYHIIPNGTRYSTLTAAIAVTKNAEIVKLLLEHGADPNKSYRIYNNKYGQTRYSPLSDAITESESAEIVKLLLEHGANPNLIEDITFDDGTKGKKSMLTYAVLDAKNADIVKLLLEHGADPNKSYHIIPNGARYSTLTAAIAVTKNAEIVKLLLEHGADPNLIEDVTNSNGTKGKKSMLTYAIHDAKNTDIVKLLLEYDVDPNKSYLIFSDGECYSSLSIAVTESAAMVKLLLEYGADPNKSYRISSSGGHFSPLIDAILKSPKNTKMVSLLLEHGANPNLVTEITLDDGSKVVTSMLTWAIVHAENIGTVDALLRHGATWDNVITLDGITKIERKFPYQKYVSKEWVKFLKARDWKGSIFG